ncbi:MAG: copper chaperone PCu(A)C [Rhodospirillales bacterium]|nr:copper chaperone PCu(A)C [Rhodospirillales bacterium]MDE2199383.1 copper chaperone PCu(A)C [Rhodospirillales bacterium]MDE2576677.1 copper chaperone PCu(A)C [Rhodospirillales bacterium]
MRFRFLLPAALLAAAAPAPTLAQTPAPAIAGAPAVPQAWARATIPGAPTAAVYLTIRGGTTADRLIAAATPLAQAAELHETVRDGDIMRMRTLPDGLPVAAGQTLAFGPGGYHIMLTGLRHGLTRGEHFPLSLTFRHAGTMQVTVTVESAGASGMGGMDMKGGAMPSMPGMGGMDMGGTHKP